MRPANELHSHILLVETMNARFPAPPIQVGILHACSFSFQEERISHSILTKGDTGEGAAHLCWELSSESQVCTETPWVRMTHTRAEDCGKGSTLTSILRVDGTLN